MSYPPGSTRIPLRCLRATLADYSGKAGLTEESQMLTSVEY